MTPLVPDRSRRFAILFALAAAAALGLLCWWLPLPAGSGAGGRAVPEILVFIGRFHPVLLHLPIGLLLFAGGLRLLAWHRLGAHLQPALTLCLWAGAGAAVVTAAAGWLLAQEGGYSGPNFDLHWRLGLTLVALTLMLLVLHHLEFRGAAVAQGVGWLAALGVLGLGSHQGGAVTHGSDFLAFHAPTFLKPLLGGLPAASRTETAVSGQTEAEFAASAAFFRQYCTECHGASKAKGDQRLHTPEEIAKGGKSGPSVTPGQPEKSHVLTRLLLPVDDKQHMPPNGKPQPSSADIDTLRRWIASGAPGLPRHIPPLRKNLCRSISSIWCNQRPTRSDQNLATRLPS